MTTSTDCIEQTLQDARELQASAVERLDQGPSGLLAPGRGGRRRPRSLAGKPLAGFRATPSRRITVLYGMIVYVIRFKNQLLHR